MPTHIHMANDAFVRRLASPRRQGWSDPSPPGLACHPDRPKQLLEEKPLIKGSSRPPVGLAPPFGAPRHLHPQAELFSLVQKITLWLVAGVSQATGSGGSPLNLFLPVPQLSSWRMFYSRPTHRSIVAKPEPCHHPFPCGNPGFQPSFVGFAISNQVLSGKLLSKSGKFVTTWFYG